MKSARLQRIVSGGQTGVDRAALDVALELGIAQGGWCPRGRLAEDGRIADRYRLVETESSEYRVRTEQNVLDSDGTLVLFRGVSGGEEMGTGSEPRSRKAGDVRCGEVPVPISSPSLSGGTELTLRLAEAHGRPVLAIDLDRPPTVEVVLAWLRGHGIAVLNVAGPRESQSPGIGQRAAAFLRQLLANGE